ncbi:MAG: iron complex transport system ATP-binding protein [Pseudohongiellaceae bacterium]|jgi:iron complex transport system ATP-binding protein
MDVLTADKLSVYMGDICLLRNISLNVESGELLSIIGPNGAGKTTLMNALMSDVQKAYRVEGSIFFCGHDVKQLSLVKRARQIACLPQTNLLNFPFSVEEVVSLGRTPHSSGKTIDAIIISEALSALDIHHLKNCLYTRLSGGEKQRVQLARVMAQIWREESNDKRLLFLDEPTTSLDLGHQQQLMKIIRDFANQGVAIVMIVHDVNVAINYSDKLLALSHSELVASGRPDKIITKQLLKTLYDLDAEIITHPISSKPMIITA